MLSRACLANDHRPCLSVTVQAPHFHPLHPSPALLDPALHAVADVVDLVLDDADGHAGVGLARVDEVGDACFCAQVGVGQDGVLFLVRPQQVADVVHGEGQDGVGGGETDGGRDGGAQQDVAVTGDNGAGHGGDEDVQGAGEDALAGLAGRGEGAQGGGERVLEAQRLGQGAVDGGLAADGLAVEGEAGMANLLGEAVGWGRAIAGLGSEVLRGLRQGGCCGLGDVDGQVVVDGLAVLDGLAAGLGLLFGVEDSGGKECAGRESCCRDRRDNGALLGGGREVSIRSMAAARDGDE